MKRLFIAVILLVTNPALADIEVVTPYQLPPPSGAGGDSFGGAFSGSYTIGSGRLPDYSNYEEATRAYVRAANYYKAEAERGIREVFSHRSPTGSIITPNLGPLVIPPIIDPNTIPDPISAELPYTFESPEGPLRDGLVRTYMDLYKVHPEFGKCQKARKLGLSSVEEADHALLAGKYEESNFYHELAVGFLDLAVGITPTTGMARSAIELIIGRNFITGAKLSGMEIGFAALNVVTFGTEGVAGTALKGLAKIALKSGAFVRDAELTANGLRVAERAVDAAEGMLGRPIFRSELGDLAALAKSTGTENIRDLKGFIGGSLTRFGPINEGLLHKISAVDRTIVFESAAEAKAKGVLTIGDCFRSSSYFENKLEKEVKLYRVYTGGTSEVGAYWSRIKPSGPYQATLDAALDPRWKNAAMHWTEITVPVGQLIYEGSVSEIFLKYHGLTVGSILGGGHQAYIPEKIPGSWITGRGAF